MFNLRRRFRGQNTSAGPPEGGPAEGKMSGGDLLSHAVPRAVPSALRGLASGFGMGPGVSLLLWPPKRYRVFDRVDLHFAVPTVSREPHSGRVASLWSSPRPISTGQLRALPHFHLRPINPMV